MILVVGPKVFVDPGLQNLHPKERALDSRSPKIRVPQHIEHVVLRYFLDPSQFLSFRQLSQHRGGSLADGTTLSRKSDLLDLPTPHLDLHIHLVAAERVGVTGLDVVFIQFSEVPRVPVIVEYGLPVNVCAQTLKISPAFSNPDFKASTSSVEL